jgi:23S rRNA pseudouridine955/2504/2580 synthase
MIAKKRSALTGLQNEIRERSVHKAYFALVQGKWVGGRREIDLPLRKYLIANGERRVSVDRSAGKLSRTIIEPLRLCGPYSLLKATLETGRTHQIRVHLAHLGFPILGDDKYGDYELNKRLAKRGLKRMFLHAAQLGFRHPVSGERIDLEAPLPSDLQHFLEMIDPDASTL